MCLLEFKILDELYGHYHHMRVARIYKTRARLRATPATIKSYKTALTFAVSLVLHFPGALLDQRFLFKAVYYLHYSKQYYIILHAKCSWINGFVIISSLPLDSRSRGKTFFNKRLKNFPQKETRINLSLWRRNSQWKTFFSHLNLSSGKCHNWFCWENVLHFFKVFLIERNENALNRILRIIFRASHRPTWVDMINYINLFKFQTRGSLELDLRWQTTRNVLELIREGSLKCKEWRQNFSSEKNSKRNKKPKTQCSNSKHT